MTKEQVKELLDHVLTWPPDEQERVARFVCEVEQRRSDDDLTDEEWKAMIARSWAEDLNDPRQDICTLEDGEAGESR